MTRWSHGVPALPQLECDGSHVLSVGFPLPVAKMVPWELAIL